MTMKNQPVTIKSRKTLTPDEVRRAIAAIEDGVSYRVVAARFHVHATILRRETGVSAKGAKGKGLSVCRGAINRK
ncbi:MAG TPA: hypothetical protein VOA88_21000 [Candidatus Dormibacteraeota bacterium]|nr:hypothetical protein [Candidatus Dormibacteraeota bacterium]